MTDGTQGFVYIVDEPSGHDFDLELVNFDDPRLLLVGEHSRVGRYGVQPRNRL